MNVYATPAFNPSGVDPALIATRCPDCGAAPGDHCELVDERARRKALDAGIAPRRYPHANRRARALRKMALRLVR